jgi:hypothetical protein
MRGVKKNDGQNLKSIFVKEQEGQAPTNTTPEALIWDAP